jgi:hypothetical protein
MKTLMLLMLLAVASLQVNAQKINTKNHPQNSDTSSEKKPLLACEESFSTWLTKSNRITNELIQPFQPLTELFIPTRNISKDLSPAIKLVALNPKNNE